MNKIIQNIKKNKFLSIVTAIFLGLTVLLTAKFFGSYSKGFFEQFFELNFYTGNMIGKLYMLIFSIGLIGFINNKSLKNYGFNRPENLKYLKLIGLTVGITFAAIIFGNIFFNVILRKIFSPGATIKGFPKPDSLLQIILTVWIWSSICEEVLVRGLVQGFLTHLKQYKFLKLSIPVWVSGLFFGAMHLSLIKGDFDPFFVSSTVFFTSSIGLLAAYYREKTNSIYPAIYIHFIANVVGSIPWIIMFIFDINPTM
jgi:membrane protease YdiL (CAAX protease family)